METPPFEKTTLQNLKQNVHEHCGVNVNRVQGDIDRNVWNYFFLHVIAYTHGSRQVIINFFFQRLYEQCLIEGIPPVWDEGSADKLLEILNRLNFDERP
jgi:hypothetical protein